MHNLKNGLSLLPSRSPVPMGRRQVLGQLSDHKLFIGGGVKESFTTDLKNTGT